MSKIATFRVGKQKMYCTRGHSTHCFCTGYKTPPIVQHQCYIALQVMALQKHGQSSPQVEEVSGSHILKSSEF